MSASGFAQLGLGRPHAPSASKAADISRVFEIDDRLKTDWSSAARR